MTRPFPDLDITLAASAAPRQKLVEILECYLADLEHGVVPDQQALLDAHPELAEELLPYLESLQILNGATRDLRGPNALVGAGNGEGDGAALPVMRQIGDYRIVREIGRGGMGIVYEAHQESLNRQVALKVLPFAAVLDQRQIARFRNEAQAAAQLHHPHIVPVFAVGQERGVYYYAMQYIAGQSLDHAINEMRAAPGPATAKSTKVRGAVNGSTTTMRCEAASRLAGKNSTGRSDFFRTVARLGREAAEALHHAHEHGIVHRDVKPSNLLIDNFGKLWVTDFGLARIQSENGMTLTGDVIGTLRYMSPEQAKGSPVVDARTDVYSLGSTLYELVTQKLAHPSDDRQKLLRQIVEDEPVAPRRINPAIPVDLETIILGAMSKGVGERYASARELADDLGRFLEGKPTLARRPKLADRAGKWARRHQALVGVAACAVAVLAVVSAVGLVLLAREQARTSAALEVAEQNAEKSEQSLKRAERDREQARDAVDRFVMLVSDRLGEIPGAEGVRRDLLLDSLKYYHHLAIDAGRDPELQHDNAVAHFKSAVAAAKLGAVADAIQEYQTAQDLLEQLLGEQPHSAATSAQLAVAHNNLGLLYAARGEAELARKEYEAAVAIQQRLLFEHADDVQLASAFAEYQANLGMLLDQMGDSSGAAKNLNSAVGVLRPIANKLSEEPQHSRNLAIALNNLSFVLRNRDFAAAERAVREAIAILDRLAEGSQLEDGQNDLALCYNNLAALQSQKDNWAEAVASHQRAIVLQEQMVRKSPAIVRYRSELATSLNNLGVAYCRVNKVREADAAFGRSRDMFAELAQDYPDELSFRSSLAAQLNNQALAMAGMGRHAESLPIYRAAIEAQRTCRERNPNSEVMRELLSKMYYNYGQSLRKENHWQEGFEAALERRELWRGNGERLLGVAAELAELDDNVRSLHSDDSAPAQIPGLDDTVVITLQQAFDAGWRKKIDPAIEQRFAAFAKHKKFAAKVAELNQRIAQATSN